MIDERKYCLKCKTFHLMHQDCKPDGSARIEDLVMLIRRLCRVVAKHDANNGIRAQALDYLHRHNLGGSPLKDESLNVRISDGDMRRETD